MLDCLIVNPSALSQIYQSLSENLTAIEPPIWAGLLANGLRARGKDVDILDCEGLGLTIAQAASQIARIDAKLVVIVVYGQQPSASTQNMHAASLLCTEIKLSSDHKVALVGGHVSALQELTEKVEHCDYAIKGEGLDSIINILEGKRPGKYIPIDQDRLVDQLPGVAWDLLPMKNYRAHNWHAFSNNNDRSHYASIYTSLGCPFKCSFCCINAPFGGSSFRYWPAEFTLAQLELLAGTYGVKNLKIADEMFVLKKDHYMGIVDGLIERQLGLNIWAYSRIDTVKEDTLAKMKKAGINWLALGIESGSKFVRDGASKRFKDDDIALVVEKIRDAGINVIGNYIFGLPDDTFETMNQTLDLSIKLNCEMSNFYSAMAYPGSKLYDDALKNNWELPKTWLGYSQHSRECLPLRTEKLTSAEVLGFRDYAFHKYFEGGRYLGMVRSKFGEDTYEHIKQMTRTKLVRDNSKPYLLD